MKEVPKFPHYVMIQTISGCNASCIFCPYPYLRHEIKNEKMPWSLFKKIIDECKENKEVRVIMPYLMNEPLLDRELPEKIKYIKSKMPWVSVHILTNGLLLDEGFSAELINSGIDWIGFSIHGIKPETIKSAMGIDPNRVINNILNFLQIAKRAGKNIEDFILITYLKHKYLKEEEKDAVFDFWRNEGIKRISFFVHPISRAGNVPTLPRIKKQRIFGCSSIWTNEMIHILANGDVVICCMDWGREVLLGNVKDESIYEIWHGSKYEIIRKKINGLIPAEDDFLCKRCECALGEPPRRNKEITLITVPSVRISEKPELRETIQLLREKGFEITHLDFENIHQVNDIIWIWLENESHLNLESLADKIKHMVPNGLLLITSPIFKGGSLSEKWKPFLRRIQHMTLVFTGEVNRVVELVSKIHAGRCINDTEDVTIYDRGNVIQNKLSYQGRKYPKKGSSIDIALVTSPPWGVNNPPVGLAYLASYIRKFDFKPVVLDYNIKFYHRLKEEFANLWHVENKNFWSDSEWFKVILKLLDEEIDKAVDEILETGAPLIGFSVVDPKERLTIEFIKRIKNKDKDRKIILGGPACLTGHSRKIFLDNIKKEIDYMVIGEGEETLREILDVRGERTVKGTLSRQNGNWFYYPRELIKDLDEIPFPTYEDFDLSLYQGKSLILEWSRGCLGKCAFCINHALVKGYRTRSAEHIFQELKYHVKVNKISEFTICDPLINGDPKVLDKLCDLILKEGLEIKWTGEAAPRRDMNIELLRKMKKAGCHKLQIGVESASDKVLRNMRKFYTAKDAEEFLRKVHLAGMETEIFIMVGFPGEGEREFNETVEFIKRNREYIDTIKSINTLHLIAGADVYENREKYKIKPLPRENWHYLWETYDGNTYEVRKRRGEYLLNLAKELGIKVMETNLKEGKQREGGMKDIGTLKGMINALQELPKGKPKPIQINIEELEPILPRRRLLKLPYLLLILGLTFIAELYLWALKKVRRFIIFPGS